MSNQTAWRRPGGRALAIAATLALVVAACGDDNDDSTAGEATAEATATADSATEQPTPTEPQATEPEATDPPATEPAATEPTAEESTAATGEASGTLKLGILGECEGAFGGFPEDVVAGATLAMVEDGGATPNSTTTALDGFTGANVGGLDIELVGIGCGDDTADRIITGIKEAGYTYVTLDLQGFRSGSMNDLLPR